MRNKEVVKRALTIGIGTVSLVGVMLAVVLSKMLLDFGIVCPFFEVFDVYCPGCGGTRMAVSMLHFHFYQAFRYNPFIFVTAPLIAVVYLWQSYEYIIKNRISVWLDKALIAYAVLLLIFGVIRNFGIFRWLAPTDILLTIN